MKWEGLGGSEVGGAVRFCLGRGFEGSACGRGWKDIVRWKLRKTERDESSLVLRFSTGDES